ncbi:tRNA methyltransferase, has a role in tRNA modification [Dispira simplex]|nr:tRNA methyltransferase, has a role in tRNA modification [Dispira simplex]
MPSKPQPIPVTDGCTNASRKEEEFVHQVYNHIAPHFSNTRYKAWPVVEDFLRQQSPGSLGADVGCGNGKYMGVNPRLVLLGSDRSSELASITHQRGFEVMVADNQTLAYRPQLFDFAISIAVIHHFATEERRIAALQEIVRVVKPQGKILVYVWALEQRGKRKFDQAHQDFMVPWVVPANTTAGGSQPHFTDTAPSQEEEFEKVFHRYYHLFKEGELESLVERSNLSHCVEVSQRGYDRDNWYVVLTKT